jgi:hypothetical protein
MEPNARRTGLYVALAVTGLSLCATFWIALWVGYM